MRTKDEIIDDLLFEIRSLKERVVELERQLKLNSQNSSKPPSSDGLRKPKPKSLRVKGKNKTGGQPKHPGETLCRSMHPDHLIVHSLIACPNCCTNLKRTLKESIIRRQVFDLTIPKIDITEHQAEVKCCPACKQKVHAKFPEGINAPVQYGPRVKSFSIYLQNQHYIPEARLKTIFKDVFNLPIACATLSGFNIRLSSKLNEMLELIDSHIYRAKIKHLDETGLKVNKKLNWLHVASTNELTNYRLAIKRGDIPDKMLGIVVHDHWKSYFSIKHAKHAICNVHILRELVGLIESEKEPWAKRMYRLLRIACRVKNKYPKGIPKQWTDFIGKNYFQIVGEGLVYHEKLEPLIQKRKSNPKRRVGHNLLLRLQHYSDETLRFIYNPIVPFTNNQAEQDLRMMKVKQKVSGCFRSFDGADTFCRIRSFLSTARKQGWNILDSISNALYGTIPLLTVS